jgi:hypothetical protein
MANILILSLPRSGSSIILQLIASAGYKPYTGPGSCLLGPSDLNRGGYFEDTQLNLLNDQLIKILYGDKYSFLFAPKYIINKLPKDSNFRYDVSDDSVFVPSDFYSNINKYTGRDWDVWGLSRMAPGEKWYKCYSKYNVDTFGSIISTLDSTVDYINRQDGLIIKDPRMALVAHLYNLSNLKIIYVERKKSEILASMKRHYGRNLFSNELIDNAKICSNFFNYKIQPQLFSQYYNRYTTFIKNYIKDKKSISIDYNNIQQQDTIDKINKFIGGNIDIKLFKLDENINNR